MHYGEIKNCDIANGPGVRVSLFVSGCTHHCPECFNEVAWDFGYGGQIVNVGCFVGSRLFVGMMTEGLIVKDITVFGNQHLTAGGGMCLDRQLADGVDFG